MGPNAMRRSLLSTGSVAFTLALVACASLPQLTFEGADAGGPADGGVIAVADGGGDAVTAQDATPLPANDSGPIDAEAPGDASGIDAGDAGLLGCPLKIPAGADTCCLTVPCVGKKCANRCPDCAVCTGAGEVCCVPNANAQPVTCPTSAAGCN